MKRIKYNKLIRDNIPEIIAKTSKSFKVQEMNNKEYISKLKEKLIEEAKEVNSVNKKEIVCELADVLEIVDAIEKYYSIDHKKVIEKKKQKAKSNGKFDKRLLLKEVIEND